jgi:hypothetical protein
MGEIIGNAKTLGGAEADLLFHQVPEKMEQPGLYAFVQQINQPVFDMPQFGSHLFAEFKGQVRFFFEQLFKIFYGKSAKAYIIFIGFGEFPVQVVALQGKLAENLPLADDFLDFFISFLIYIPNFNISFLDKIKPVVVKSLKVNVFPPGRFNKLVFDVQFFVFLI